MRPQPISLIVTTYGTDSYYTQACLEAIRRWKSPHHELIVVSHDESPLLRAYLDSCAADGLIDRLVFAVPGHGHTRGFNLGVRHATAEVVFNICNDILIGPSLVDDCAIQLRRDPQLGLMGWHWYNEGTTWRDGRVVEYSVRDGENPELSSEKIATFESARWFTGRYFEGIGGRFWINLCNTAFFGIRREVLDRVGGGFGPEFSHYWADDFLNYAVLDQGLDIRHFDGRFRGTPYFAEFQYDNVDVEDRRRNADMVRYNGAFLDTIALYNGGMSQAESVYLHLLAKAIPENSTVLNVGVWYGASAVVLLDAMKSKRARFHFIDCFDLPGISEMSAQWPVTQEQFESVISPYVRPHHEITITRANTLTLGAFPPADFVFLDAGHTAECIAHDSRLVNQALSAKGVATFHDYGYPGWPAVKPTLDDEFKQLDAFETVAVHRRTQPMREEYHWPDPTP